MHLAINKFRLEIRKKIFNHWKNDVLQQLSERHSAIYLVLRKDMIKSLKV